MSEEEALTFLQTYGGTLAHPSGGAFYTEEGAIRAIQSAVAQREAAIVKWLREQASDQCASRYHRWSATLIADAIERGDHR